MYRIWIYTTVANSALEELQNLHDEEYKDDESDDESIVELPENFGEDFLNTFPTDELCEIGRAHLFLIELLAWACNKRAAGYGVITDGALIYPKSSV